jgi:hypothetical protein
MKRSVLFTFLLVLFVCGCGGGSSKKVIAVAISPSAQTKIDAGQTLSFTAAVANDAANKGVTWSMSGGSCSGSGCGTLSSSTSAGVTYTAPATVSASTTVSVVATSVSDSTKSATAPVVVSAAPSITTATLTGGTVGAAYSAALAETGGSGTLTWALASGSSLPAGLSLSSSGTISGTPTSAGTTSFTVKVTDSSGGHEGAVSATKQLSLTINPVQLAISTTSLANGVVGTAYGASLASTGGTGTVSWSVTAGSLPAGLSLGGSTIAGTPTTSGMVAFTVTATDSGTPVQTAIQPLSITINSKLAITAATIPNGIVGTAYSANLASTGGAGTITWSVATGSLPAGLTLSTAGAISGTPTTSGSSNFTVQAKDSGTPQQMAQQTLTVTIYSGLTITTTTLPNGAVNSTYSAALTSAGGAGSVTWSVSEGSLPTGLTLSTAGVISGTPTASGLVNFTVSATDSSSPPQSKTQALSIMISPALSITTTSLPAGTLGASYSQNIQTSGGTLPITWSVATGGFPAGLTLAGNSSGVGVISGTPTTAASYTFTVTAKDSSTPAVSFNQQFTVVISAPPLTITTTTLPNARINSAYSAALQASGGTAPYTWTVASGSSLPSWLTLGGSGTSWTLSGTPTTATAYNFSLTVKDSSSPAQSQTQALTLTVLSATACSSGNESVMKGQYAFLIHGYTNDGFLGVIGSFTADGSGNITAGYADTNSELVQGNGVGITSGAITTTGSSYTLGSDNRGCYTIVTPKYTFNGRFAISPTPSGSAQGTMVDLSYTATGQIFQQQVPSTLPTGNWVYAQFGDGVLVTGVDVYGSAGAITNGEYDSIGSITGASHKTGITGTYTTPDPVTGRYTLTTTVSGVSINRAAYLVSGSRILEITANSTFILAGEIRLQSGSLTLSGTLATYGSGQYAAGFGLMNAAGSGYTANYYIDDTSHSASGNNWETPTPVPTTCSYTIDSLGRVATSGTNCGSNMGYASGSTTLTWITPPIMYLSGPSKGVVLGGAGLWKIEPQTAASITSGDYYFGTQFSVLGSGLWEGSSGVVSITGGDTLVGTEDAEGIGPNVPISAILSMNADGTFTTSVYPGYISGMVVSASRFVQVENPTKVPEMQVYDIIP